MSTVHLTQAIGDVVRRALAALALAAIGSTAAAQHDHAGGAGRGARLLDGMGSHSHRITTASPLAQRFFDQGLSLAYAFNHGEAKRSFLEAIRLDSTCAMCYWGVALTLGPNINASMDPVVNGEALAAARNAVALSNKATPKERAFIGAMARRYAHGTASRAGLDSAYAMAMRDVARHYPDDGDAAALFAEAMMDLTPWVYWSKTRTPLEGTTELLAALERSMKLTPKSPGGCHLYIHAVEAAYPERALPCAEKLAALMPGAGHLVHMPAHIYLRVGRYNDAITANQHATHADETYFKEGGEQGFYAVAYYPHNYHFLGFAAIMAGRYSMAMDAARSAALKIPADIARDVPDLQLVSAYPSVTLATFGRWEEVLREPLPAADLKLARGLAWYARGVAFAGTQRFREAGAALDSVRAAGTAITTYPGAPVLRIATHALAGDISARQARWDEAVASFTAAMEVEDSLTYMEPPYWHLPVRHLLGATLLDAGRPKDAESLFAEDLARFPENVWSLRGLVQSLLGQRRNVEAAAVLQRYEKAARQADVKLKTSRF